MPTCGFFGVGSSTSYREQDEGALYLRGLAASGSGNCVLMIHLEPGGVTGTLTCELEGSGGGEEK